MAVFSSEFVSRLLTRLWAEDLAFSRPVPVVQLLAADGMLVSKADQSSDTMPNGHFRVRDIATVNRDRSGFSTWP